MGKNENLGFYLINYAKNTVKLTNSSVLVLNEYVSQEIGDVFTSKYNSFDFYLWHFKELWFNFKIHSFFFLTKCCQTLVAKREKLSNFKPSKRVLVWVTSCQTTCWYKVWSLY